MFSVARPFAMLSFVFLILHTLLINQLDFLVPHTLVGFGNCIKLVYAPTKYHGIEIRPCRLTRTVCRARLYSPGFLLLFRLPIRGLLVVVQSLQVVFTTRKQTISVLLYYINGEGAGEGSQQPLSAGSSGDYRNKIEVNCSFPLHVRF